MIGEININDITAQIKSDIDEKVDEIKPLFENDREYYLKVYIQTLEQKNTTITNQ